MASRTKRWGRGSNRSKGNDYRSGDARVAPAVFRDVETIAEQGCSAHTDLVAAVPFALV